VALTARIKESVDIRTTTTDSDTVRSDVYRSGVRTTGLLPTLDTTYVDGTGANQAQKHYHKKHTLAGAASVTIDLNAAVDERGVTHNFANIKEVMIRLRTPTTTVKVVVGNAASDPWAPWLSSATATEDVFSKLRRSNPVDGWTVPAAANLKIANPGGTSVDVDVSLIGH
jgi:hypothetical protein